MRNSIRRVLEPTVIRDIERVLLSLAVFLVLLHAVEGIVQVGRVADCNRAVTIEQVGVEEGERELKELGGNELRPWDNCCYFDDAADEGCTLSDGVQDCGFIAYYQLSQ